MSCDQQVDALVAAPSSSYVALGYAPSSMAAQVDGLVTNFLSANGWPGAAISITYKGQLVFARAYGYGDSTAGTYMEPDSRFRVASVTKPITALAILKMIHDGQPVPGTGAALTPDSAPFTFLNLGPPFGGGAFTTVNPISPTGLSNGTSPDSSNHEVILGSGGLNPLLKYITVADLLYHAGGWNRGLPVDDAAMPGMVLPVEGALGLSAPASAAQSIQFMLNQPLQFYPGTAQSYSNLGFWVLGEVIAESSGMSYEDYVTRQILNPLKMNETTRGLTFESQRQDREVSYFSYADTLGTLNANANFILGTELLPPPYGGSLYLEGMTAGGSWVSSAIDLARFTSAIRNQGLGSILTPAPAGCTGTTYQCGLWPDQYYSLSSGQFPATAASGATCYFGMGWDAIACGGTTGTIWNWYKTGGLPGTTTEILLTEDGFTLTGLFNADGPNGGAIVGLMRKIHLAVAADTPSVDLLPAYGSAYTAWMTASTFQSTLTASSQSASRVDGRWVAAKTLYPRCTPAQINAGTCPAPTTIAAHPEFRARLAPVITAASTVKTDRDCASIASDIAAAQSAGQIVVSLQKFYNPSSATWRYQAAFAPPP